MYLVDKGKKMPVWSTNGIEISIVLSLKALKQSRQSLLKTRLI